jgi:gamma-polyglutamate biosynthesis protein CapA
MKDNKFLIIAILVFITASGLSFFFTKNSYFKKDNTVVENGVVDSWVGEKNNVVENKVAVSNNLIEQTKRFFINKKEAATSKDLSLNEIKVLFLGDIMMDRFIRKQGEKFGYDFHFACAAPTFKKYDFVVANFESTVTNYPSVSLDKTLVDYNNFKFTVDPVALTALKNAGINVVGVDNNHIYDHGKQGVDLTRQNILANGLNYFGDPIDQNYSNLRLEKNGVAFNLVSFNEFFGSLNKTLKNIEKVKSQSLQNADEPIIIFAHWGDEYVPTPDRVKNWAYLFIDSGADLIIGMHPHVTQETETYQNKFIAYSLGNFLFDQYFSPEVQKGGAVEMILNKDGIVSTRFLNVSLDAEKRPCIHE